MKRETWAQDLEERAKRIRLVLLDVDGVMTDGRIIYGPDGEWKFFDIKDGLGIKLLQRAGVEVGILSGRRSAAVARRAKELGIRLVRQNTTDKGAALEQILKKKRLRPEQVCFVGDDLPDLPVFRRVGLPVAVADAAPDIRANARYVTEQAGGRAAIREVCELIIKSQGKWASVTNVY